MSYGLKVKTAPSDPASPVSVFETKTYCRINHDDENEAVDGMIRAGAEEIEDYCGRAWLTTVYETTRDYFPDGRCIELPRSPGISVVSVKYRDADNVLQTFADTNYVLDTYSLVPRIVLDRDSSWPATRSSTANAVIVEFSAGYGTTVHTVSWRAKLAIKMWVAHWYEFRGQVLQGTIATEIPGTIKRILAPLVISRIPSLK